MDVFTSRVSAHSRLDRPRCPDPSYNSLKPNRPAQQGEGRDEGHGEPNPPEQGMAPGRNRVAG